MDEFVQTVNVRFKADKESLDNVKKDTKSIGDVASKGGSEFGKKLGTFIGNGLQKAGDKFVKDIKQTFSDAWKELDNILGYSRLSNAKTRELAFTYGFSGSQAYGYEQARNLMGYSGMEDLMYASESERKQFAELFSKYTDKYSQLYDSGFFEEYRNFQVEMEDFKQEVMLEVVQFFMNNKDLIKTGFTAMLELAKIALSILQFLVGGPKTESQRLAEASDIINNYAGNNVGATTNVKIDNTFNNVSSVDQGWLANAGQMTYEQVIQALR